MTTKRTIGILALTLLTAMVAIPAFGQAPPGRGNFDPAQFRQRMLDRIKEVLGANDEDFKALQPKIEQVMDAQQATRGRFGGFGRGGPGGGAPGGDPNQPTTPIQEKTQELQTALDNKDTKPEELKAKLAALREARAKAKDNLAKAQKELSELLTQRQEAGLVMMGILE